MFTKEELRKKAKQIRNLLDINDISSKINAAVQTSEIYQEAKHVMLFYPLKDEIDLRPLLKDNDKQFYLPKLDGDKLVICPYKEGDKLVLSTYNTQEPLTEPVDPGILDIIFIPALMVDKEFNRLGYGKGYYDKFLATDNLKAIRIVPIPSLLVKEELPSEEFDVQFDIIIDET